MRARGLLRRRPRDNQKGFTLIEMLVVISILGILAAVVTLSMVGITKIAQTNADSAELKTVQLALDTMAAQQQLNADQVCPSPGLTNQQNMQTFPASSSSAPVGQPVALYPTYLHKTTTSKAYNCLNGIVSAG